MTAKIIIERISRQTVRVTLTADIEISVNADLAGLRASAGKAANGQTFSPRTPWSIVYRQAASASPKIMFQRFVILARTWSQYGILK